MYEYPNQASQYENMLKSNSKGKWVWRNLRRKNVLYRKIGVLPLPDDIGVTDEEIFQEIDNRYMADLTRHVDVPVFQSFEFIKGINYQKIQVGNINVYKAITSPLEILQQPITIAPSETIEVKKPLAFETTKTASQTFDVFSQTVQEAQTPYNTVKNVLAKSDVIFNVGKPVDVKLSLQGGMAIKPSRSKPQITVPNLNNKSSLYGVETFTHEFSHMTDFKFTEYIAKKDDVFYSSSASFSGLGLKDKRPETPLLSRAYDISTDFKNGLVEQIKQVGKNPKEYIDNRPQSVKDIFNTLETNQNNIITTMNGNIDTVQEKYSKGQITYEQAQKERDKIVLESSQELNKNFYNEGAVVDIYDAITGGYMKSTKKIGGHGVIYYQFDSNSSENRLMETYANLNELAIHKPEYIEVLRQDIPDVINAWENMNNFINEVTDGSV
jgi:hypothetical protein